MDSIYVVTKTPENSIENLKNLFQTISLGRYDFVSTGYIKGYVYTDIYITKTNKEEIVPTHDPSAPRIKIYIYEDNYIHKELYCDKKNKANLSYIFAFESGYEDFLLDFMIQLLEQHSCYQIVNVNLKLQSLEDLKRYKAEENANWRYIE